MKEEEFSNADTVLSKFQDNNMAYYVHKLNKFFLTNDQLEEKPVDVNAIAMQIDL